MERRLAAILAADVVAYTRLMGVDEAGTLRRMTELREEVLHPLIAEHRGRVVKLMGDGLLLEFSSVVDAVACALAWQKDVANHEADGDKDTKFRFRIGINLGDVIVEGDDIHGDGVNIAARLEGLAEPGGICLSGDAYRQAKGKIEAGFEDMGEQDLKNVAEPVSVYRIAGDGSDTAAGSAAKAPLSLPDKPSVAILPFENKSSDAEQGYFADGLTENIITGLTRFQSLFVIAVASTFITREKGLDAVTAARELGVAHIVDGSVRKAGNRVRVTAQLVEADTGRSVWAETYDRDLEDIFIIQDEITDMIVATVVGRMEDANRQRAERKDDQEMAAFDCVFRGRQCLNRYTKDATLEARTYFNRALELDSNCAAAYAGLAMSYSSESHSTWSEDIDASDDRLFELAQKAVALDANDDLALYALASAYHFRDQNDQANAQIDKAIDLNPNDYHNMCAKGWFCTFAGNIDEGLAITTDAMRRNPYSPDGCHVVLGLANYVAHDYEAAIEALCRISTPSNFDMGFLTACYGQLGRTKEAKGAMAEFLKLTKTDFIDWPAGEEEPWRAHWKHFLRFSDPAVFDHLMEGLKKAGLST
jgi:TolB-like protein/tetratricopeptide (TPR) repeat protein